jgi:hypothetical protein
MSEGQADLPDSAKKVESLNVDAHDPPLRSGRPTSRSTYALHEILTIFAVAILAA